MIDAADADEAWWPPTFSPERFGRTRFAWWIRLVASQSTRACTASRACRRPVAAPRSSSTRRSSRATAIRATLAVRDATLLRCKTRWRYDRAVARTALDETDQ